MKTRRTTLVAAGRAWLTKLGGTLSVPVSVSSNPARAAQQEAVAKRMAARQRQNSEAELSETNTEP